MASRSIDQLLEVLPTSKDLLKLVPSISRPKLKGVCKTCSKSAFRAGSKGVKRISTQITKNPPQAIALFFLLGLTLLFVTDSSQSYKAQSSPAHVRSGDARGVSIKTIYSSNGDMDEDDNLEGDHAPLISLPTHFNFLSANNSTVPTTPVFWYTPRSGGRTLTEIFGKCRGMVMAGAWIGTADELRVVHENGMKQITADLTSKSSRNKARDMGLRDVHTNVMIVTPNVYESSDLFAGSFQAELWTWFRDPVERQISYYFYLKSLPFGHPQYSPLMQGLSLGDWALTQFHTPNAMISSLLGVPTNPIGWTEMDLTVAKNLLRAKAKVGLLDKKAESVRRFLHRHNLGASGARECQERLLDYAWTTKNPHDSVGRKTDAYQLLLQSNSLDVKLYEYAVYLFQEQAKLYL